MKKILLSLIVFVTTVTIYAQASKIDALQALEGSNIKQQQKSTTATMKSSSRLFGDKNDLTTVILIIPSGSKVNVLDSDSTYLHVVFEENEGYVYKRHALIDMIAMDPPIVVKEKEAPQEEQAAEPEQMSRFSYLESKYGSNMAARLISGKIWKGMNSEMVKDSWGTASKVNRVISGNLIKEEWIYRNTWLYFENNTLVDWGPISQ